MPPIPPICAEGLFSVMFRASSIVLTNLREVPSSCASTYVAPESSSRSVPVHSTTGIPNCGIRTFSALPWKWYRRAAIDW